VRPASPFVPAAIESPPPDADAAPVAPEPVAPESALPGLVASARPVSGTLRGHAPLPVRPARLQPGRVAALPSLETVAPAVMPATRLVDEEVAPEPAALPVPDAAPGRLQIGVRPWAAIQIDGRPMGETPVAPLDLAPGVHTARLEHPDFQPLVRKVTVVAGETVRLQVDLTQDGVAR
jgi:hypothetical protein